MNKALYAALLILPFVCGCSSKLDDGLGPFTGQWTPLELNENGHPIVGPRLKNITFVFQDGKYNKGEISGASASAVGEHKVRIDSTKTPGLIDLVCLVPNKVGLTQEGIYLFEGDKLKLCLGELGGSRPTEFAPGPRITLATLEHKQ